MIGEKMSQEDKQSIDRRRVLMSNRHEKKVFNFPSYYRNTS